MQKLMKCLLIAVLLFSTKFAFAQTVTITGTVTDEAGISLIGVNVSVKGTTEGTITDVDGKYSINTSNRNVVLVFSFIGYVTQEKTLGNQTVINVTMVEDVQSLDELVVVGYGTQKKVNLTGSISTTNEKALANRPITNSTQALQGMNGLWVNQEKGRPGADGSTIRIRGAGTLNNNDPLVLVDGIEFPLSAVNPNDIESISVLKDAASAAIYGNRAANGVVLVTTKKGSVQKVKIDYNGYYGMQNINFYPRNVVTDAIQSMEGLNRAYANEGKQPYYTADLEDYKAHAGTNPYIYSNTDWFKVMFRTAPIQEHNLRLYGGSEKTTYSVSLGYMDQEGILINSWANKYSMSAKINTAVNSRLNVDVGLTVSYWDFRESSYTSDDANGESGIMGLMYRGLPWQAPTLEDGAYADQWIRAPGHNFFRNPYALSFEGYHKNSSLRNLLNVSVEYTFPFDIKYKLTGAANLLNEREKFAWPTIMLKHPKTGVLAPMGNIPNRGVQQFSKFGLNLTSFQTLSWDKRIQDTHEISVLGGFSLESFYTDNFNAAKEGYNGNELNVLDAGSLMRVINGTETNSRLESFFGRLHYGFRDRYIVEANFRYDGSSRFAPGHQWGFFPSFSGAWRINQEGFMKDVFWIDNLKLRASWGKLGNQNIDLFRYISTVSTGIDYNFNGNIVGGAAITQIADPNVSWESTIITDIGFDLGLFNNKLSMEFDWFNKKTVDILRQVNIATQVGNLAGPFTNIGSVSNKGMELTLNFRDRIGDLGYSIGGNVTRIENKVLDLKGNVYYANNEQNIIKEGWPINAFYGKQTIGIFQSAAEVAAHPKQGSAGAKPGDLKYKDLDGNGVVDNGDRTMIGNSIPKFTYSFNLAANFKRWELALFFQGVGNVDTYVNGNLFYPYRNGAGVTKEWLTDSWTPENPTAKLPRLTTSNGYPANFETSDFWIQDASYLRLKNAQLSYNLPESWLRTVNISKVLLFVNAQNYLTFSKFKFGDPEREVTRAGTIAYPLSKAITGGVNITF